MPGARQAAAFAMRGRDGNVGEANEADAATHKRPMAATVRRDSASVEPEPPAGRAGGRL